MATLPNILNCASRQGHTGVPTSCTHNPDLLIGILAVPKGTVWASAQLADIQTTIQDGLINDTYASGYHYFGDFVGISDDSEDRQQETLGYGEKVTTRDEQYYWTFRYTEGHMCKHKAYLKFKGRENEFDFFLVDKSRNIIGTEAYDADGFLTGMKGLDLYEFYENNWKPKDGTNDTMYQLSIGLRDSKEINEYYAFITVGFKVSDLNQIQDALLIPVSTLDGGDVNVQVVSGCGGLNMVKNYPDIVDATLFTAVNKATGADIPIDGLTSAGTGDNQYLVFDLDETDPDYPASGEDLQIVPDPTSDFTTAGISYFSFNTLTLTEV